MAATTSFSSSTQPPVLIIGAGVAGLAIGQGLLQQKIPFKIFEANAHSGTSQGHRFRLSREALGALHSLLPTDLQDLLRATQANPSKIEPRYVNAKTLEFPKAKPVENLTSVPVDRSWLRSLLALGVERNIVYEKRFEKFEFEEDGVKVYFNGGTSVEGRFLVGADGIKSHVRGQLQPDRQLLDLERDVMWGRTVLTSALRKSLPSDLLSWLMILDKETNRQLVIEPMEWSGSVHQQSDGHLPDMDNYVCWVLCTAASDVRLQSPKEKRAYLLERTRAWHSSIMTLLQSANFDMAASVRVLSSKPDIGAWPEYTGKLTLVGDAAHPMSSMGGAGADTAIRDAAGLCNVIAKGLNRDDVAAFEEDMRTRAKEKIMHSFRNGEKIWAGKAWFEYEDM